MKFASFHRGTRSALLLAVSAVVAAPGLIQARRPGVRMWTLRK